MWAIVWTTTLLAAAPQMEARTLDDRQIDGRLVALTAEHVVLDAADGPVTVPIEDLLWLTPEAGAVAAETTPGILVELVDGTSLVVKAYDVNQGTARLTWADEQTAEIPTAVISAVRFREQAAEIVKQWEEIVAARAAGDVLVIRKGAALDYLEGVLGDTLAEEEAIEFTVGDTLLPVKRTKIEGLLYAHPAGRALPEARCLVLDNTGGRIPAGQYELAADQLHITTPAGLRLKRPLETIVRLDFSRGKVEYLGQMKPESIDWTPYFAPLDAEDAQSEFFRVRTDRGLREPTLSVGGRSYQRGLALHSRTELVYRLDGRWRSFQAVAGIDDAVQGKGHVRLTIRGDGRVLYDEQIAGRDPPRPLSLDVSGVRRLTILVDFGDDLDVADHLDLCEARIIK